MFENLFSLLFIKISVEEASRNSWYLFDKKYILFLSKILFQINIFMMNINELFLRYFWIYFDILKNKMNHVLNTLSLFTI